VPDDPIPHDRAVIDRIVDGITAVLLVGPDEIEAHVPAASLPDDARDGTWLVVDVGDCTVRVLEVDRELTERRAADVDARLARLREQRRGGRFER
jgi:hypothetical protein